MTAAAAVRSHSGETRLARAAGLRLRRHDGARGQLLLEAGEDLGGVEPDGLGERADVGTRVDAGRQALELAIIDPAQNRRADPGALSDIAQLESSGEPGTTQTAGNGHRIRSLVHRLVHRIGDAAGSINSTSDRSILRRCPIMPAPAFLRASF